MGDSGVYLFTVGDSARPPECTLALASADWISGGDDSLVSTSTLTVLERLFPGDEVYVATTVEGGSSTQSGLSSSQTRAIYFTGQKISD